MSSKDGGHGSQDNVDKDMCVDGDDEQSDTEEGTGSDSANRPQFSPDSLGGRAIAIIAIGSEAKTQMKF